MLTSSIKVAEYKPLSTGKSIAISGSLDMKLGPSPHWFNHKFNANGVFACGDVAEVGRSWLTRWNPS